MRSARAGATDEGVAMYAMFDEWMAQHVSVSDAA
jgi:hypothetical protein